MESGSKKEIQEILDSIDDIHHPHDAFFAWTMGIKSSMAEFLELHLSPRIRERIKLNTLIKTGDTYVDP